MVGCVVRAASSIKRKPFRYFSLFVVLSSFSITCYWVIRRKQKAILFLFVFNVSFYFLLAVFYTRTVRDLSTLSGSTAVYRSTTVSFCHDLEKQKMRFFSRVVVGALCLIFLNLESNLGIKVEENV